MLSHGRPNEQLENKAIDLALFGIEKIKESDPQAFHNDEE